MKISVIIPTLNAGKDLSILLRALFSQKMKPDEIIIADSASDDDTVKVVKSFENIKLLQIARKDFDHGKTRDIALRESTGDIVIFFTQDAIPANNDLISEIISPLKDKSVAVSTCRQIAKKNASRTERLIREFNYPEQSMIKSKQDIPEMGIKTFFSSDVCAAYNREIYIALGGFEYPVKTSEDMFYAAKAVQNGYKIAYSAEAVVYHSHNFNIFEQYRRNYIQGYELERHKNLLSGVNADSEGIKLVKYVSKELLKHGHVFSFAYFFLDCCARKLGNIMGKRAFRNE